MEKRYKQRGYNKKYPLKIITWQLGEAVPEWLSNIAKVGAIDSGTGELKLEMRDTNTGGFELLDSSGSISLVKTKGKFDLICKDLDSLGNIFSLTPLQFNLIYEKDDKK